MDWLFAAHLGPPTDRGCLEWDRSRTEDGYGRVSREGRTLLAHRYAWELAYGPIPPGLLVLHWCDNPPCCEPTHLHLGTHADNARERDERGRTRNGYGAPHSPEMRRAAADAVVAKISTVRRQRVEAALGRSLLT